MICNLDSIGLDIYCNVVCCVIFVEGRDKVIYRIVVLLNG